MKGSHRCDLATTNDSMIIYIYWYNQSDFDVPGIRNGEGQIDK